MCRFSNATRMIANFSEAIANQRNRGIGLRGHFTPRDLLGINS
jgi:hypothetical protein